MADPEFYPNGRIALGNGDLEQVTDVNYTETNSAEVMSTLREAQAGIKVKPRAGATVTFNANIPESGSERDYLTQMRRKQIKDLRIKVPGKTLSVTGLPNSVGYALSSEGAIVHAISYIGFVPDD